MTSIAALLLIVLGLTPAYFVDFNNLNPNDILILAIGILCSTVHIDI